MKQDTTVRVSPDMDSDLLVIPRDVAQELLSPGAYAELLAALAELEIMASSASMSLEDRSGPNADRNQFFARLDQSRECCPECGGDLIFQSGCKSCSNPGCGWGACS